MSLIYSVKIILCAFIRPPRKFLLDLMINHFNAIDVLPLLPRGKLNFVIASVYIKLNKRIRVEEEIISCWWR